MSSDPADKDRSNVSPHTAEPSPVPGEPGNSGAEWPRLLARVVEGIVRAELHQFEENVMAFLNSAVADAYATFIWISARIIGAAFLLTALVLFLGIWLQWWIAFALVGVAVIAVGSRLGPKRHFR
jgi:hypothetical protein